MGKLEKEITSRLKQCTQIPKSESNHVYCLTHTYDENPRRFYVETPYNADEFEAICAYIQFECSEIEQSYSMDQAEVIEILEEFYDCKKIKRVKATEVDLYENWEYFCGSDIQSVDCLKRERMEDYFNKYIEEFYKRHPEWKPTGS